MRHLLSFLLLAPVLLAGEKLYDYREITLGNGLRVVTLEDFSSPIVAVQVWYHVGSRNEDPERQGFAHMFEHMMFRGTERVADREFDKLVKRVGGNSNAYTSFDNTTYICELPSNQLEMILWLEAERMIFLKVDEEGFHTERKVVEEERRESNLNPPYGTVPEKIVAEVFRKHPYRWMPIGRIPHLRKATIEELEGFWAKFYVPNNAVLVVCGAVKHEEAQKLAKKHFGWIPRCPDPPRITEREPPQEGPRELTIQEKKGPVPILGMGFRTVPQTHEDATALDLCMQILGGGESSRLYRDLVKERKLAQVAMAGHFTLEQDGIAGVGAVLSPMGGDKEKALVALQEHVDRMKNEPVEERELEKVKNQMLLGEVTGTLTVAGKARQLGNAALLEGDANRVNTALERIRAVTVADIQRVAKTYLVEKGKTTVRVEPNLLGALFGGKGDEDEGAPPPPEPAENRTAARTGAKAEVERPDDLPAFPPLQPPFRDVPALAGKEKRLENGLRVVVVPHTEVPFVSVFLGLRYGAWAESKPGVASLALAQLTQGTEKHDAKALAEELEFHAISLGGGADHDGAQVSASCLKEKLPLAMGYLAEVVLSPTFPKEELEIARQQLVTNLTMSSRDAGELAGLEMRRRLYGDHPYGRRVSGEIEDARKIAPEDLQRWWGRYAQPSAAVLYVAGDVQPEEVHALAEKHLGGWKTEAPEASFALPGFPERKKTHIVLVDVPGSAQSEIRVGHRSITRQHKDWHPSRVFSHIFGGGMLSRLNDSLRVEKGLTYGASGGLYAERMAGALSISTSTKTPQTAEAVQAILDVIAEVRETPPTAEEMELAAAYLVGQFAGRWETPQSVAGDLWFIEQHGVPETYFQDAATAYSGTSAAEVLRIAREHLDPEHLVIVVAGDAGRVKESLAKIGPVEVVKP